MFQRLMDLALTGLIGIELFEDLNDVVIYANTLEEHGIKFNNLPGRITKANLHLTLDKCEFLRPKVGYLGHISNKNGVRPDPRKAIAVKHFPVPKTQKNVKQFLGLDLIFLNLLNSQQMPQDYDYILSGRFSSIFVWEKIYLSNRSQISSLLSKF